MRIEFVDILRDGRNVAEWSREDLGSGDIAQRGAGCLLSR
jgi:hypothetical protein